MRSTLATAPGPARGASELGEGQQIPGCAKDGRHGAAPASKKASLVLIVRQGGAYQVGAMLHQYKTIGIVVRILLMHKNEEKLGDDSRWRARSNRGTNSGS